MNRRCLTAALTALLVSTGLAGPAQAVTNAEKCAAAKMKVAAKYAACRLGADSKALSKGEPPDYAKCTDGQLASWQKIEDKFGVECITSGDQASVETDVTDAADCVSNVLAGSGGTCEFTENPACAPGGVTAYGYCFVLSAPGDSCNAGCGLAGMQYDSATVSVLDAGNLAHCLNVLDLMGYTKSGQFQVQGPPYVGCSLSGTTPYHSGSTTDQGQYAGFQRVCACHY